MILGFTCLGYSVTVSYMQPTRCSHIFMAVSMLGDGHCYFFLFCIYFSFVLPSSPAINVSFSKLVYHLRLRWEEQHPWLFSECCAMVFFSYFSYSLFPLSYAGWKGMMHLMMFILLKVYPCHQWLQIVNILLHIAGITLTIFMRWFTASFNGIVNNNCFILRFPVCCCFMYALHEAVIV